jgi:GT2 family glycosyltransferase
VIRPDGAESIAILLRLMHEHNADLAAPKLVGEDGAIVWANPGFEDGNRPASHGLSAHDVGQYDRVTDAPWVSEKLVMARREVVKAVGGLDLGYDDTRTALVDFSLRARQRQFKCTYLGVVAFTCATPDAVPGATALQRLRLKWAEYPHLFR